VRKTAKAQLERTSLFMGIPFGVGSSERIIPTETTKSTPYRGLAFRTKTVFYAGVTGVVCY
jgi:hypothetical protein